jgi:hypothetical protein
MKSRQSRRTHQVPTGRLTGDLVTTTTVAIGQSASKNSICTPSRIEKGRVNMTSWLARMIGQVTARRGGGEHERHPPAG